MSALRFSRRWFWLGLLALLLITFAAGYHQLQQYERERLFDVQPGTARWFAGMPAGVQEEWIALPGTDDQYLHGWWWPAENADAPALLYLHGVRWNLTGQIFRLEQLRAMGYSILAIDYRGFGQSSERLPSEQSVYEDARAAWQRLTELQPDAGKRYIYGHSLGGAVAINLASELDNREHPVVSGLIVESTFTRLTDAVKTVLDGGLPLHLLLSQRFDSVSKVSHLHMPILIAHGLNDTYLPARFAEELFEVANEPKSLVLIKGADHNNSLRMGRPDYRQAMQDLFKLSAEN